MAMVIDDLHCLYLGVTKRLINLWFGKSSRGKDYFIGNKVRDVTCISHSIIDTDTLGKSL